MNQQIHHKPDPPIVNQEHQSSLEIGNSSNPPLKQDLKNSSQRQQQLILAQQLRQQLEQEIDLQQKKQLQPNHLPPHYQFARRQPGQHPLPDQQLPRDVQQVHQQRQDPHQSIISSQQHHQYAHQHIHQRHHSYQRQRQHDQHIIQNPNVSQEHQLVHNKPVQGDQATRHEIQIQQQHQPSQHSQQLRQYQHLQHQQHRHHHQQQHHQQQPHMHQQQQHQHHLPQQHEQGQPPFYPRQQQQQHQFQQYSQQQLHDAQLLQPRQRHQIEQQYQLQLQPELQQLKSTESAHYPHQLPKSNDASQATHQSIQNMQYQPPLPNHKLPLSIPAASNSPQPNTYAQNLTNEPSLSARNVQASQKSGDHFHISSQHHPQQIQNKLQSFLHQESLTNIPRRNFLPQQSEQLEHHHHHHQHHHQLQVAPQLPHTLNESQSNQIHNNLEMQKKASSSIHQRAHTLHIHKTDISKEFKNSNNQFSTLPITMTRPLPPPRTAGNRRAPIRRQNSFSGFPSSSAGVSSLSYHHVPPSTISSNSVVLPTSVPGIRNRMITHNPIDSLTNKSQLTPSSNNTPPSGSNVILASSERISRSSTEQSASQGDKPIEPLKSFESPQCFLASKTSVSDTLLNNVTTSSIMKINARIDNKSNTATISQQPQEILNVRNNLINASIDTSNNTLESKRSELTVSSTSSNHYANAVNSQSNKIEPRIVTSSPNTTSSTSSIIPMTTSGSSEICSSQTGVNQDDLNAEINKSVNSEHYLMSATPLYASSTSSKKRDIRNSPGIFYSLPRHATSSSNPSLMRASASGLGLYFMSRRESTTLTKESAAKQLGVAIPTGTNKFRSLPRPSKYQSNVVKSQGYQSLPRPSRVLSTITMLSLPPTDKALSNSSKAILHNGSKKINKESKECADGKENVDIKTQKKRDADQGVHKQSYKDLDLKYQSLPRRKDMDLKHLSLPKKIPKELKDIDAKYQSLPKKKFKDSESKYQSLPKRNARDSDGRHSNNSRRSKESDSRHSSSKRSSSRESDCKIIKKDSRSPPGYNKVITKRTSDLPRSPRWIPTDSDEDEMYSSMKARDDSPNQSSVPEIPYSRPLPPLPVPSRYRRRTTEKGDDSSPPLPPPRLSTSVIVSQNGQYNIQPQNSTFFSNLPPTCPSIDGIKRIIPGEISSSTVSTSILPNMTSQHTKIDYSNDSGYHPPPPRIPPSKKLYSTKSAEEYFPKNVDFTMKGSPQGMSYPVTTSNEHFDNMPQRSVNHSALSYLPGSALTLPYPGSYGSSHSSYRNHPSNHRIIDQLPPGATYPRNHATKLGHQDRNRSQLINQHPIAPNRGYPVTSVPNCSAYKYHYLDMIQHGITTSPRKTFHSSLPPSVISLPELNVGINPGGYAGSRALFTGLPRDSVTGIPPPLDPPPKIPFSETSQGTFPVPIRAEDSPLYASDPLYEVPQVPLHHPDLTAFPIRPNDRYIREQHPEQIRMNNLPTNSSRTPSPDNLLTRTEPSGEEDHYSSIPSLMSTTPETPSTLPRGSFPNRVANSSSWDSLGSSGFSSMGSSQGLSGNTSSSRESAAARRRRRARSDPRMDSGTLNRLSFSICNNGINIDSKVCNLQYFIDSSFISSITQIFVGVVNLMFYV